jgi:chromosome partitioning protein
MLIAVATRKGGVGKTTIATNLAASRVHAGYSVKCIDADFDEYLYMWGMLRRQKDVEPTILLSKMTGQIYADLMAEKANTDTVIVDVGGKHSPELVYAIGACDVLVIPAEAGQYDVWSLTAMSQMIAEMRAGGKTFRVIPVMNKISSDERSTLTVSLQDEFGKLSDHFDTKPLRIVRRNAFSWAAAEGKGVIELTRNRDTEKAQDEIAALYAEVFK